MVKVSVIIPNYNHALFLDRRIESILNQTFQDFEIIFLDDNSTDRSKEVFARYEDNPRITHAIFNAENSGSTFKQWNKGFSLAAGEYAWIAESDDYAAPRFLEELVAIMEQNKNVGLVYCQSCLVDNKDEIISPNFLEYTDCFNSKRWNASYLNVGKDECINFLAAKNTIPNASAVLIRKSVYRSEVDRGNEIFKVTGDWFTWSKILLVTDIYFVSQSLNYFRFSQGSVSRNNSKLALIVEESLSIVEQIEERVPISDRAKEIFFCLVSSWWLSYLISEKVLFKRELDSYLKIVKYASSYKFIFSFHWQLGVVLLKRLRYLIKLGTRLRTLKNYLKVRTLV
ncbi:glycosyltransferase family 2 protein [Chamaesiphon sp. OTE_20_metabat_361]|uniref:glycosyltransferase family 2 protein n=1 Tax=Chamaesiphon sp. OTE_20_metabat_361 TaxID=2964689 RepID=UPI00286CA3FA|nr:glycosyltransferase family 2 protein [Chamaesiphon sp. OTE_20_metabat_361]